MVWFSHFLDHFFLNVSNIAVNPKSCKIRVMCVPKFDLKRNESFCKHYLFLEDLKKLEMTI